MKVLMVSGSRADEGLLAWPRKVLAEDPFFEVRAAQVHGCSAASAQLHAEHQLRTERPNVVMLLGDRFEVLGCAIAAHLQRVPIAHLCGGDRTEGSYDDAMRDAISRMATIHFVTSTSAMARLAHMGCTNIHLVGSPSIDAIRHADWKRDPPYKEPYCVVSYQAETIDGTNEIIEVIKSLPMMYQVFIMPNRDAGSDYIRAAIKAYCKDNAAEWHDSIPHLEFLNLIAHCEEFIGNSSAMLYEAPELKVKTRMIGKRQRGRTIPWGDGLASQRIANILKYAAL